MFDVNIISLVNLKVCKFLLHTFEALFANFLRLLQVILQTQYIFAKFPEFELALFWTYANPAMING